MENDGGKSVTNTKRFKIVNSQKTEEEKYVSSSSPLKIEKCRAISIILE